MTWRLLRQRDPTTTMMALVLVLETEIRMLLGYVFCGYCSEAPALQSQSLLFDLPGI